jgi:hypothetical protein
MLDEKSGPFEQSAGWIAVVKEILHLNKILYRSNTFIKDKKLSKIFIIQFNAIYKTKFIKLY